MKKIELKNITKAYEKGNPVIENLDLEIEDGSFTVLLGPSGCGKSTILRMIAGLEDITEGELWIDGKDVKHVEPGDRHIAMVFQNYAIYPTMSVRDNIEFGLKNLKVPKEERDARIDEISKMVGLEKYLDRKPSKLSGGQRQRVALARAIVKKPSVFLMDEPLSNLDAKLRTQIRAELIELYRRLETTFVYVTHDQVEAMSMSTHIVLLNDGKIQQTGSPMEIYEAPSNIFTARFIGSPPMNILEMDAVKLQPGIAPPEAAFVGFRPEKTALLLPGVKAEETFLTLEGDIVAREILGDQILYKLQMAAGVVHAKTYENIVVEYGACTVAVQPGDLYFFGADENRIEPKHSGGDHL